MSNYLPITLNCLRTNTIVGCDIYLLVQVGGDYRYVLYCKGDTAFESKKREMLLKKNIDRLFIGKNDHKKFNEYLETNLPYVLANEQTTPKERAKIVYSAATNLVQDIFEDPRSGNIDRSKKFASNMVDYILKDGTASYSLLKLAAHEYRTYAHSVNVAAIGSLFTHNLGLNESDLKSFCTGMLLHDLGKTKVSPSILNKKGKLTKEEYEEMKIHPEWGIKVLKETENGSSNGLSEEQVIILQHHENCDGSGYPYGLKKNEIHPSSHIVHIVDVYDALTSVRSYSSAFTPFDTLKKMKDEMNIG